MANKQNPILAAFEAKLRREFEEEKAALVEALEARHQRRLAWNSEINLIATLIAGSRLGFIGHKRGDLLLGEILEVKKQLADDMTEDAKADKALEYTKADLAGALKQILGPEGWDRSKELFTLLYDYWNE